MLFNSYAFILVFLPLTALIYFILGRWRQYQIALGWLVCASLFFYGWWNPTYLILLIVSILVNFTLGSNLQKQLDLSSEIYRRTLLTLGLVFNLGLLGYFKYANFIVDNVDEFTGTQFSLDPIILPLAISFFTFQQVAFLVDAYKGEIRDLSLLHYFLFVTFFPQLVAGPIVHHRYVLPQFAKPKTFSPQLKNIVIGLVIFSLGLFKKVMLADTMAEYSTPVFELADAGQQVGFLEAWLGSLAYTLQIYFDFSGYSDMAIGLGRLFGIKLPLNFNSPYKATSVIEFWRRWHMTLSQFLRDYLYFPLGGSRNGPTRRYANLMIVMVLGGLWHGAGWTFALWGGLHGLYLMINHGWRTLTGGNQSNSVINIILSRALTFFVVVIAWVPFRSETFSGALKILRAMSGQDGIELTESLARLPPINWLVQNDIFAVNLSLQAAPVSGFISVAILLFIAWVLPNTQEIMRDYVAPEYNPNDQHGTVSKLITWKPNIAFSCITGLLFVWALMILDRPTEFLYFQF